MGGQRHAPAALLPGKTRYSLYRRLGGHQGRSGRVWENSPQPGFDPRTVKPVASRYTDWAIPAPVYCAVRTVSWNVFQITFLLRPKTSCLWKVSVTKPNSKKKKTDLRSLYQLLKCNCRKSQNRKKCSCITSRIYRAKVSYVPTERTGVTLVDICC